MKPKKSAKSKESPPKLKIRDIKPQKDARGGRASDPCTGGELKGKIIGHK